MNNNNKIIVRNGSVIDGTGAAPVAASILIEGGKIAALGAAAEARSEGTRVIDASGQTVMPGLIDAHCHLAFDDAGSNAEIFHQRRNGLSALVASYNARKLLRAGVTGILDPDSTFENMGDVRDAIEANIIEGPRMSCGAYALINTLGGTAGTLINDRGVTGYYKTASGKDEIVAEVRRQIKHGADWIKVHVTGVVPRMAHLGEVCVWSEDELKIIADTAHDLHTPVMGHCRGAEATRRTAVAGFDFILHATAMDDKALREIVDRKIPLVPALTFQANMVDFGHQLGTAQDLISLFEREITDSAPTMIEAHKAGVPILCGSESGFSMVPYGEWHYREMEVFVKYFGFTPLEAIRSATFEGARAIRMEGRVGAILEGYEADIIFVNGRVEQDVTILGDPDRIVRVMISGKEKNLDAPAERNPIPGWRLAGMGSRLDRDFVRKAKTSGSEPFVPQELH